MHAHTGCIERIIPSAGQVCTSHKVCSDGETILTIIPWLTAECRSNVWYYRSYPSSGVFRETVSLLTFFSILFIFDKWCLSTKHANCHYRTLPFLNKALFKYGHHCPVIALQSNLVYIYATHPLTIRFSDYCGIVCIVSVSSLWHSFRLSL